MKANADLLVERLFREHGDALFRFFHRQVSSRPEAEDLVMITFIELWRKRAVLTGCDTSEQRAIMYGFARNTLRHRRRTEKRARKYLAAYAIAWPARVPDEASEVVDLAHAEHLRSQLPREFQETWWLHEMDGHSYQEIADRLGVPIGTVRSRIARSRAHLQAAATRVGDDCDAVEQR